MASSVSQEPVFILSDSLGADEVSKPHLASPADSRSTSTGSLSPCISPLPSRAEGEIHSGGLPDYEYPVPFFVRNTFIDAGVARPLSLDEFYEERRIHSCPVEAPPGLGSEDGTTPLPSTLPQLPVPSMIDSFWASAMAASAAAAAATAAAAAASGFWMPPPSNGAFCPGSPAPTSAVPGNSSFSMHPPSSPAPADKAPVLRLADVLVEPDLGSDQLPTVGSAGHRIGTCKPCAFYHTKGCGNGTECPFCHLCAPGEKKRRQKSKWTTYRDMKRMGLIADDLVS